MGDMADYYNSLVGPDDDGYEEDCGPPPTKCKFCGATGLYWMENNGKWRLAVLSHSYADGPNYHVCEPYEKRKTQGNLQQP